MHEALGGTGVLSPMPEIREVDDLDGGPAYPILIGDYTGARVGSPCPSSPARRSRPPTPIFPKLDPSVVDEELARLQ